MAEANGKDSQAEKWLNKRIDDLRSHIILVVAIGFMVIGWFARDASRHEGMLVALEERIDQTSKNVAELTKISKQSHTDIRDFIDSINTRLDKIVDRLFVMVDPSTEVFVELTAKNIDGGYDKPDRLRLLCKVPFSKKSMVVSLMLPSLSKVGSKGIPSPLFMTAEPIRGGDEGCYLYLHTIVDNKKQRFEIEKFLTHNLDIKLGIDFLVHYTKRE